MDDARLAEGLHVGDVDLEDSVHGVERQDNPAFQGDRPGGLAAGRTARSHRNLVLAGVAHDGADVCGRRGDDHRIGRARCELS